MSDVYTILAENVADGKMTATEAEELLARIAEIEGKSK